MAQEGKLQGISSKTLNRAKGQLDVTSSKEPVKEGRWLWKLPPGASQDVQDAHVQDGGHLRENESGNHKKNNHLTEDGHSPSDDDHLRESCANKDTALATSLPLDVLDWPAELQEDFEERAAIMEWDGGFSKQEAEREAKKRLLASAGGQVGGQTVSA